MSVAVDILAMAIYFFTSLVPQPGFGKIIFSLLRPVPVGDKLHSQCVVRIRCPGFVLS